MNRLALGLGAALAAAGPALAHPGPAGHGSFAAGFSHPMLGADHVLAMLAVGLWAALLGGRALWALPAAFVAAMALGFGLALAGLPLPLVEPTILASVLLLGVLAALAARLPLPAAAALVAALALFHGHAHGTEMAGAKALGHLGGLVLATSLLHAAGVTAGRALARSGAPALARCAGAAAALAGSALVLAG